MALAQLKALGGGWVSVTTGMKAPDFTLSTVDGEAQTLSTLLKSKPVLIECGAWTCAQRESNSPSTRPAHAL